MGKYGQHINSVDRKMNCLIIKIGALGDVVRTTILYRILKGKIWWVTSKEAAGLLPISQNRKVVTLDEIESLENINFDLVINLEENKKIAKFVNDFLKYRKIIGVFWDRNKLSYTKESSYWFDMGLISKFGKKKADELKWKNKKTYQEILCEMLGYKFKGEEYFLNYPLNHLNKKSKFIRIAIEKRAGEKWPLKKWPYYHFLKKRLEKDGYEVFYLKQEKTLIDYLKSIEGCDILICGDTLAMHLGLYLRKRVVAIFTCTSPWEIYDYGRMIKVINPLLKQTFYKQIYNKSLIGIKLDDVYKAFRTFVNMN